MGVNEFLMVEEVVNSWTISQRRVRVLCGEGRFSEAEKEQEFGLYLYQRKNHIQDSL